MRDYRPEELRKLGSDYAAPFEGLLDYLIPDPEARRHFKRWAATLMAVKGAKILYAPLLVSEEQGVGKTTVADIIGKVLGEENYSKIPAASIVDATYQYWGEKQLIVISEIHEGHQVKIYNNLKEVITDSSLNIHKKYQKPYDAPNFVNIYASSNNLRGTQHP